MKELEFEFKSNRSRVYELKVGAIIQTMVNYYEVSFSQFIKVFNEEVDKIKRQSAYKASNCYEAVIKENPARVEVWHLNSKGDQDRLMCVIKPLKN
jgi:hypothetical protein